MEEIAAMSNLKFRKECLKLVLVLELILGFLAFALIVAPVTILALFPNPTPSQQQFIDACDRWWPWLVGALVALLPVRRGSDRLYEFLISHRKRP